MDANDFPRLFYTSMPSSSTSNHRIDRLSSSSSSTFRRDDFRRHSTTTSSEKFSTISIGESVKLEEENGEIPEKFVQEEDTVVKTEETRVSDCDFSLTFYTAHVTSSSMLSRGDSSSINNKTFTPDDHYSNPSDKRREVPSIRSTSSNSSSFGGHVAFVDEPSEENQRQQQQYQQHQFQLPTLLVTSTPSTVFDQNDDDVFTSPYHPPNRQYSSSSEMSGLSFQLQSGIHKKSIAVEGNEIALRDLRNEAFQFVKEIYPEKKCGSLEDYILLYKHDLRSINILQLITTSSDVTDGTLVEIVIGCEFLI